MSLTIERAVLREIPLRLREYFEISSGGRQDRRIVLLTLYADGLEAWSECVAAEDPSYSAETTDTAWHVLTDFILPAIVGRTIEEPGDILDPVRWIRGNRMAKAAVEMGAWDLVARSEGVSLSARAGGTRERVAVGVSVGLKPDDEALRRAVGGYVEEGYSRIKIKIKPGRDVEMLRAVRAAFPDMPMMADANSAYTLSDLDRLQALDELGLTMIEQPLRYDDFRDHAELQASLSTPICLDESIESVEDTELALGLGACRVINVKPGRVGGFGESLAIHGRMQRAGLPVWCGGMLESGVGRAYNVALASLPGFSLPGDISASRRYWAEDIVDPEFVVRDGHMEVPTGPGIGVAVDVDRVAGSAVRTAVFVR
jgi:O-succinylbenzoate synthase